MRLFACVLALSILAGCTPEVTGSVPAGGEPFTFEGYGCDGVTKACEKKQVTMPARVNPFKYTTLEECEKECN